MLVEGFGKQKSQGRGNKSREHLRPRAMQAGELRMKIVGGPGSRK